VPDKFEHFNFTQVFIAFNFKSLNGQAKWY